MEHMSTGHPEAGAYYAELYNTAQFELSALREELAKQVARTNDYCSKFTGAEQRNSELIELLGEVLNEVPHGWGESFTESELAERIRQAIKPTESGASE